MGLVPGAVGKDSRASPEPVVKEPSTHTSFLKASFVCRLCVSTIVFPASVASVFLLSAHLVS